MRARCFHQISSVQSASIRHRISNLWNNYMGFFDPPKSLLDIIYGDDEKDRKKKSSWPTMYDDSFFKLNDEARADCEEIYSDRAHCHDLDIESHYGWEHKMDYDTDGYSDEEDW